MNAIIFTSQIMLVQKQVQYECNHYYYFCHFLSFFVINKYCMNAIIITSVIVYHLVRRNRVPLHLK
jgi:hypothetical protein